MNPTQLFDSPPLSEEKYSRNASPDGISHINLCMWHFNQCDPKRCSGKKLKKHHKITELRQDQKFFGILLVADAPQLISREDRSSVLEKGICVIDCSWNRFNELNLGMLTRHCIKRKLPFLIATNECHFGRPFMLNCAEALAAALVLTDFEKQAYQLMASFSSGVQFFVQNSAFFNLYLKKDYTARQLQILSDKFQNCFTNDKKKFFSIISKNRDANIDAIREKFERCNQSQYEKSDSASEYSDDSKVSHIV